VLFCQFLFDRFITKDVVLRCRTKKNMWELANFLAENIGREISTRRLGNTSLSHQTVNNYLDCLGNSFLFLILKKFTGKTLEKYSLPRKVYLIDPAIYVNLTGREELGRMMENATLIELLRVKHYYFRPFDIYYYKEKDYEVDFVLSGAVNEAIQVTYDQELREREIKALEKFSERFKEFGLKIITWDREGVEELRNGKKVSLIPLWKFLLYSYKYV